MNLSDLKSKIVIENPKGSYKKFADTLDEYPILGVTFPTDYGYIEGYIGEDNHDLDVFVGSGTLFGILRVKRNDIIGGIETKFILNVTSMEYVEIEKAYGPVVNDIRQVTEIELIKLLKSFIKN